MTLRKGFTRLEGVADAKLIIKPPHMLVRMKPGFWPDVARMQETVKKAGYQPIAGGVQLRVSGKVVEQAGGLALELDGMQRPAVLRLETAGGDPAAARRLREMVGRSVEIEGAWQPPAEGAAGAGTLTVAAVPGPGG